MNRLGAHGIANRGRHLAEARAQRLGRGVNLGNALEAPAEGEWGMVIEAPFSS